MASSKPIDAKGEKNNSKIDHHENRSKKAGDNEQKKELDTGRSQVSLKSSASKISTSRSKSARGELNQKQSKTRVPPGYPRPATEENKDMQNKENNLAVSHSKESVQSKVSAKSKLPQQIERPPSVKNIESKSKIQEVVEEKPRSSSKESIRSKASSHVQNANVQDRSRAQEKVENKSRSHSKEIIRSKMSSHSAKPRDKSHESLRSTLSKVDEKGEKKKKKKRNHSKGSSSSKSSMISKASQFSTRSKMSSKSNRPKENIQGAEGDGPKKSASNVSHKHYTDTNGLGGEAEWMGQRGPQKELKEDVHQALEEFSTANGLFDPEEFTHPKNRRKFVFQQRITPIKGLEHGQHWANGLEGTDQAVVIGPSTGFGGGRKIVEVTEKELHTLAKEANGLANVDGPGSHWWWNEEKPNQSKESVNNGI